jgi:hypothetical protein
MLSDRPISETYEHISAIGNGIERKNQNIQVFVIMSYILCALYGRSALFLISVLVVYAKCGVEIV